jgi:hypothetical protein
MGLLTRRRGERTTKHRSEIEDVLSGIEILCEECGNKLSLVLEETTYGDKKGRISVYVTLCDRCLEKEKQESYDEGWEASQKENYNKGFKDGFVEQEEEVKQDLDRLEQLETALDRLGIEL